MRTTLDLPDTLFREAKAQAALEGLSLKELMIESLRARLNSEKSESRKRNTSTASKSWKTQFNTISAQLSKSAKKNSTISAVEALQNERGRLD